MKLRLFKYVASSVISDDFIVAGFLNNISENARSF